MRKQLVFAAVVAMSLAGGGLATASPAVGDDAPMSEQPYDSEGVHDQEDAEAAAHPLLEVIRYAGANRYGTNFHVNFAQMETNVPIFVATGSTFPDALSIGPVVAKTGGALFLTSPNQMDVATVALIEQRTPSKIYLIGGTGAVSENVRNQLEDIAPIERISGDNRYATNLAILKKFYSGQVKIVYLATGVDFPDALSASAAAGLQSAPVVLVDGKSAYTLPPDVFYFFGNHGVGTIKIIGGQGAVNHRIFENLIDSYEVRRYGGADRYATNMAVNDHLGGSHPTIKQVWIATGKNFPDALSAAGLAGHWQKRLVLSNGACIPKPVVSEWINRSDSQITRVYLVGGTGVLSPAVQNLTQCG